jgi:hypothetical protein
VNKSYTDLLLTLGIRTAAQLLDRGRTKEERKQISLELGIPEDFLLELVKLSNLARIPGLAKKRARLYYDAGFDT